MPSSIRKNALTGTALASCLAMAALSTSAFAQAQASAPATQAPPTATPPANDATTQVTVTAKKPADKIDRQVYDNTKDIDSQTGTAADALNKVPGVNVDPSGNVTLRGKAVQVMINGRPSLLLQGDNRAAALQSMPSSYITSIEVIPNPGAQYGSEGAGGLINIVTKPKLPPGGFGSINGQLTSTGGYTSNVFDAYQSGKLTVIGVVGFTHGRNTGNTGSLLQQLDSNGHASKTTLQDGTVVTHSENLPIVFGSAEYALNSNDTLTGQASYIRVKNDRTAQTSYGSYDSNGAATDLSTRLSTGTTIGENENTNVTWTHAGQKVDEKLKIYGSLSRALNTSVTQNLNSYTLSSVPGNIGSHIDSKRQSSDTRNGVLSVDYDTPVGNDQLTTGAQITYDDKETTNLAFGPDTVGTGTPTPNPLLTSDFTYQQTISAAYFTYQKELGDKWTVLGGLRSETLDLNTDQLTTHVTSHVNYTKLNPSFFASYILSPKAKLRFSYSHRLQRPTPQDLNPNIVYVDAQDVSVGNPNLKPQETNSFELGYEYAFQALSYSVRGFYRKNDHALTSSSFFIPDPQHAGNQVLETTRENFGSGDSGGFDFNINDKLSKKLSVSLNGTLSETHLQTPSIPGTQSATALNGNISFNYTADNKDRFQLRYNAVAKQLTGQGYTSAYGTGSLQYSHNITPKLQLVVVANDIFRTAKYTSVTDTPTIHNVNTSSRAAPTFYIALSHPLGGGGSATVVQH